MTTHRTSIEDAAGKSAETQPERVEQPGQPPRPVVVGKPLSRTVTCLKPSGCGVCGAELTGRRRRWCSDACREDYYANHRWTEARWEALMVRAKRICAGCGGRATEVDHIQERNGYPLSKHSCLHHQENLRALCHSCHVNRRTLLDTEQLPLDVGA